MISLTKLQEETDIQRVVALEAASYPADEAASDASIRSRQREANAYFQIARRTEGDGEIVGFVNGTLTAKEELDEESMHAHDPAGSTLCIHSVVIDAAWRRQGLAKEMLKAYVRLICEHQIEVKRIVLIAKPHLVVFYVHCGFTVTRLSPVVHGKDAWMELAMDCNAARRLEVVQVDAFTTQVFNGNPAAIVQLSPAVFHSEGIATWMQQVAKENNLSETAYLAPRETSVPDEKHFDLRWFTPGAEVKLCGHATLASAFLLFTDSIVPPSSSIHFHTLSGELVCTRTTTEDGDSWIEMDFPTKTVAPIADGFPTHELTEALNLQPTDIIAMLQTLTSDVLVHVAPDKFEHIKPNFTEIAKIDARGVIVTSASNESGVDFQSRFFGPRVGVTEDPVTGSAHCALAPYWAGLLGKTTLLAHQVCPTRGGYLRIRMASAGDTRVILQGQAVVSLRGELLALPPVLTAGH